MIKKFLHIATLALAFMAVACGPQINPDLDPIPGPGPGPNPPTPTPGGRTDGLTAEAAAYAKSHLGCFLYPENPSLTDSCIVFFNPGAKDAFYGKQTVELWAHIGLHDGLDWYCVQSEWAQNTEKTKFKQASDNKNIRFIKIKPSIKEWFAATEGKTPESIAVVVRNSAGTEQTKPDYFLPINGGGEQFTPVAVEKMLPPGFKYGINYVGTEVTLVLYDKDTKGKMHDWVCILGDFNDWTKKAEYCMYKDSAKGVWWYTFSGLERGREYRFNYLVGSGNTQIRIHDPYTEIVYDGYNDKYITDATYPGLSQIKVSGFASAFTLDRELYQWHDQEYALRNPDDLVIYELLFRDFSATGDINGALEHFDYIKNLGVTAIELMPVQEFDGNDSWGYNPYSFFALDKAYGSREKYKEFIDKCHQNGIAVLFDVVYNHATGSFPYAKLWWDDANNCTSATNPFFNVSAPHPYGVFHDFNHESQLTKDYIKESLTYLIREYHVDGFRFDLTKGFTNTPCNESNASNYDQKRINILKDYAQTIFAEKPNAVIILEHFCEPSEEIELGKAGMRVWSNANNAFSQSAMGYDSNSNFGLIFHDQGYPFGSKVGFAESHDEERNAYKAKAYGATGIKNNVAGYCKRLGMNAAFLILNPGPKMIWQFGELGYDISIEQGGRTAKKPLHWEYYNDANRKALYDTYAKLLAFRKANPDLFENNSVTYDWNPAPWSTGFRSITCNKNGKAYAVFGNFDTVEKTSTANFGASGNWKSLTTSAQYSGNTATITLQPGEFVVLYNF